MKYDYIIIGAGISGCCVAYELSKYHKNILLVDKLEDLSLGASGASGGFLSPLLGKPNKFKDLVTKALNYSIDFYTTNFEDCITRCGTTRIPKNDTDKEKFLSYIPYMDFEFSKDKDGYHFPIGSIVETYKVSKAMVTKANIETKFDYNISKLEYEDNTWVVNNKLKATNIILTTGYDTSLLDEFYLKIRPVWGVRANFTTKTKVPYNYHKACSVSRTLPYEDRYLVSIGATHHREKNGIDDIEANISELLIKAKDIVELEELELLGYLKGGRASSFDYFPVVGELIDSKKTLEEFPYLKYGTNVSPNRFTRYPNLFVLNGVGGRGFVLAPYLAKELVEFIVKGKELSSDIKVERLFKREVKRVS